MTEKATFGAGCFWGVEVDFRNVPGVKDAAVGYMPFFQRYCAVARLSSEHSVRCSGVN